MNYIYFICLWNHKWSFLIGISLYHFQRGGGNVDGIQAKYHIQCSSLDATYSIVGSEVEIA